MTAQFGSEHGFTVATTLIHLLSPNPGRATSQKEQRENLPRIAQLSTVQARRFGDRSKRPVGPGSGQLRPAPCQLQGQTRPSHPTKIGPNSPGVTVVSNDEPCSNANFCSHLHLSHHNNVGGNIPPLSQILAETPFDTLPPASRLPL